MATIPSYLSWVPKTGTGNAQIKINSVRDRKSTRLNSSHSGQYRMPSSA